MGVGGTRVRVCVQVNWHREHIGDREHMHACARCECVRVRACD